MRARTHNTGKHLCTLLLLGCRELSTSSSLYGGSAVQPQQQLGQQQQQQQQQQGQGQVPWLPPHPQNRQPQQPQQGQGQGQPPSPLPQYHQPQQPQQGQQQPPPGTVPFSILHPPPHSHNDSSPAGFRHMRSHSHHEADHLIAGTWYALFVCRASFCVLPPLAQVSVWFGVWGGWKALRFQLKGLAQVSVWFGVWGGWKALRFQLEGLAQVSVWLGVWGGWKAL
jgi:hypothetical protein